RLHPLDVVLVVRKDRDEEEDAIDDVARDRDDVARVGGGEARRVPVELQVARPAVDHPARRAAGARAPIALLEQQHRQSAKREVARYACAGDTAADDDDVMGGRLAHEGDPSGLGLTPVPSPKGRGPVPALTDVSSLLRAASGTLR